MVDIVTLFNIDSRHIIIVCYSTIFAWKKVSKNRLPFTVFLVFLSMCRRFSCRVSRVSLFDTSSAACFFLYLVSKVLENRQKFVAFQFWGIWSSNTTLTFACLFQYASIKLHCEWYLVCLFVSKTGHFPFVRASRFLNVNKSFSFTQCKPETRSDKAFFQRDSIFELL